jgi:hypothetical protein
MLAAAQPAPEAVVRQFVADYNARDFDGLEAALAPDAKWYSVKGAAVSVEGDGAPALVAWMKRYLGRTCPSCRSELLAVTPSGQLVSTVERAMWTRAGACVSQSGPAVYEISEGRIHAVWYFPASPPTPCPTGGSAIVPPAASR